jgi:hypothetical protein
MKNDKEYLYTKSGVIEDWKEIIDYAENRLINTEKSKANKMDYHKEILKILKRRATPVLHSVQKRNAIPEDLFEDVASEVMYIVSGEAERDCALDQLNRDLRNQDEMDNNCE